MLRPPTCAAAALALALALVLAPVHPATAGSINDIEHVVIFMQVCFF